MPDHAHKTLDIVRKPRFNALRSAENHPNPLYLNGNRLRYLILKSPNLRPSDSVVLAHDNRVDLLRRARLHAGTRFAVKELAGWLADRRPGAVGLMPCMPWLSRRCFARHRHSPIARPIWWRASRSSRRTPQASSRLRPRRRPDDVRPIASATPR